MKSGPEQRFHGNWTVTVTVLVVLTLEVLEVPEDSTGSITYDGQNISNNVLNNQLCVQLQTC